jgi:hypothetical protein
MVEFLSTQMQFISMGPWMQTEQVIKEETLGLEVQLALEDRAVLGVMVLEEEPLEEPVQVWQAALEEAVGVQEEAVTVELVVGVGTVGRVVVVFLAVVVEAAVPLTDPLQDIP